MSNRSYTYHTVPMDWINPDPKLTNTNYNWRFFLIQTPLSSSILLAKWQPPATQERGLTPIVGDLMKVQGDPRTFKIQFIQHGTDPEAGRFDAYVEIVTPENPESDPLYDYEAVAFQKIF